MSMRKLITLGCILFVAIYSYIVGHKHGVAHGISVGRVRELVNEGYSLAQAHHRLKTDPVDGADYPEEYNPRNYRH